MFGDDQKVIQRIAPALQRVLIVDPSPSGGRMLADLIRNFFACHVWIAPTKAKAVEMLQAAAPQVVFVEQAAAGLDGVEFTRQLRRSELSCRQVPVIICAASPTAQSIRAARDAGVHEVMCKPFTTRDLLRRLEAVALRPRPWVEAVGYVGPDRRRFNTGAYEGPRKRKVDTARTPEAARIAQAFKILKSATLALTSDPMQALRSMRAQAIDLYQGGVATKDARLATAASDFMRLLSEVRTINGENAAAVLAKAGELLTLAPTEAPAAPARQAA